MKTSIFVSSELLHSFFRHQGIQGLVPFMEYLRKDGGLKDFASFCEDQEGALFTKLLQKLPHKIIFHGSQEKKIEYLRSPEGVYATDDPNYAIFLACLHIQSGVASVVSDKKKTTLTIDTDFINGTSEIKDGYIHIVSEDLFTETGNREYKAEAEIPILFTFQASSRDLTAPIIVEIK